MSHLGPLTKTITYPCNVIPEIVDVDHAWISVSKWHIIADKVQLTQSQH